MPSPRSAPSASVSDAVDLGRMRPEAAERELAVDDASSDASSSYLSRSLQRQLEIHVTSPVPFGASSRANRRPRSCAISGAPFRNSSTWSSGPMVSTSCRARPGAGRESPTRTSAARLPSTRPLPCAAKLAFTNSTVPSRSSARGQSAMYASRPCSTFTTRGTGPRRRRTETPPGPDERDARPLVASRPGARASSQSTTVGGIFCAGQIRACAAPTSKLETRAREIEPRRRCRRAAA